MKRKNLLPKSLLRKNAWKRGASLCLAMALAMGTLSGCGETGTDAGVQTEDTAQSDDAGTGDAVQTDAAGQEENTASEGSTDTAAGGADDGEVYVPTLPTGAEEADIYVEPIEGLSQDFIKGMDISSILVQEASGVVYYNEAGQEQDIFQTLADAGVNYIRVRVWNDPYDKDGNGYGGGNNDVEKAAIIGKRAADYGMKLLVDFHYSDFWADPKKQFAPKDWKHLTFEDKKAALYQYTEESLTTILEAGADVGMVQIGNEINNGMAGETENGRVMELLIQGSSAVRAVSDKTGRDIKIAVHYTDIDDASRTLNYAKNLQDAGVDYDIFGVSYYPFWHGSMENMTAVLKDITAQYGKETVVMETSYAYTVEDGDGSGNSVSETDLVDGYTASVQSQATCIRDVMAAAAAADSLGVFYWEGAWIPVGSDAASNAKIWEEYGSGWASSFAAKYDPNDAGLYYGGCSWDNQAMFDYEGHPLASLDVFKYVNYGATCERKVDYLKETVVEVNLGEELVMPTVVEAVYNDRASTEGEPVTWDETQLQAIDTSVAGGYTVNGTLADGTQVMATIVVENMNWLENAGFEESDVTMWKVAYEGTKNPTDIQNKAADCMSGENSFHFWSESEQEFTVEQTVSGLAAGSYTASTNIQGGDVGKDAEIRLYVIVNGELIDSEPVTLAGWCNWQMPQIADIELNGAEDITVGVSVKCAGGGWGTMDDFLLYKQQ